MTEIIKTYQGGPDAGQALVTLEGFIGDVDSKTIGTETTEGLFDEEGTVDASDAVTAINALIWSLEQRDAEIERLRAEHDEYVVRANANVCVLNRDIERLQWVNRKLFGSLKDMTEFWRYGLAQPDGAQPTADDQAHVEKLAKDALDALVAAYPDYAPPPLGTLNQQTA